MGRPSRSLRTMTNVRTNCRRTDLGPSNIPFVFFLLFLRRNRLAIWSSKYLAKKEIAGKRRIMEQQEERKRRNRSDRRKKWWEGKAGETNDWRNGRRWKEKGKEYRGKEDRRDVYYPGSTRASVPSSSSTSSSSSVFSTLSSERLLLPTYDFCASLLHLLLLIRLVATARLVLRHLRPFRGTEERASAFLSPVILF